MKRYLFTLLFLCCITISFTQNSLPKPVYAEGCENTEQPTECSEEKLRTVAYNALTKIDMEKVIAKTEKDTIFMNTKLYFLENQSLEIEKSSMNFHESELNYFDVDLSFSLKDLPFAPHADTDKKVSFRSHLYLVVDRKQNKLIPLPEYTPKRIPFSGPEVGVIYPGCEKTTSNEERKRCMTTSISKFVGENFDNTLGEKLGLDGINRIYVVFKINKEGGVEEIRSRAPHPQLEKEAIRVIKMLPPMQPAIIENTPVSINYALPIVFNVQGKEVNERKKRKRNK